MNPTCIRFCCSQCGAKIKAPIQLSGQGRECPGCGHSFIVPRFIPQDVGPVLVLIEGNERCSLGVAYPRGALNGP